MSSLQRTIRRTISRALATKGLNKQQIEQRKKLKEAKKAWRKDN